MKRTPMAKALLIGMFAATLLIGCGVQNMNGSMDNSRDIMSGENMDSGMGSIQEDAMQNMQDNKMEKTMEKTVR